MALKRITRVMLTVFALTMAPAVARGNPIQIVGNALGCFGLACTPAEAAATVIGGVPITFVSSPLDFSGLTDPIDGGLAINTQGTSTTGNFGIISIGTATPATSVATPFTLLLQFTSPETP